MRMIAVPWIGKAMIRGLFRAWLVISFCWILLIGLGGYVSFMNNAPKHAEPNIYDQFDGQPTMFGAPALPAHHYDPTDQAIRLALLATIPVIALFIFGWAIIWVGRGFERK
jgi:hypothetical protein